MALVRCTRVGRLLTLTVNYSLMQIFKTEVNYFNHNSSSNEEKNRMISWLETDREFCICFKWDSGCDTHCLCRVPSGFVTSSGKQQTKSIRYIGRCSEDTRRTDMKLQAPLNNTYSKRQKHTKLVETGTCSNTYIHILACIPNVSEPVHIQYYFTVR